MVYKKEFSFKKSIFLSLFCMFIFIPVIKSSNVNELVTVRYCLKAIEYYLFLANNLDTVDYNNFGKNYNGKNARDVNEEKLYSINLKDYFISDDQKKFLSDDDYNLNSFVKKYSEELFIDNTKKENNLFIYSDMYHAVMPSNCNLNIYINKKDLAKLWLFFILCASKYYKKIVSILNSKKDSLKDKKNDNDVKLKSSCTFFYEYYNSKIKEYKIILNSFKQYYEKNPYKINDFIYSNYKKVFIESYKDMLYIDFRRKGTSKPEDSGFDQFPTTVFN